MFIVHVFVHVKPDDVEAFKKATIENAHNSVQEPGIARFDVVQQNGQVAAVVRLDADGEILLAMPAATPGCRQARNAIDGANQCAAFGVDLRVAVFVPGG